ncbi:SPX domain-containing protein 1 [Porphyridium purpureum]|uniref:SPX domain-containing protein 1 n=1 Tax=Porphyridium purpureum TaxID=35688 RepID=A0A5J4YZY2_PORPP|nr:SPX domain-containing protein 1 [Porphyridium purpureum]|eukprot:POR2867..scf208_2
MKWGKYLNAVANEAPAWTQYYINYKRLKYVISEVDRKKGARVDAGLPDDDTELKYNRFDMKGLACHAGWEWKLSLVSQMTVESLEFLEILNEELLKINTFFEQKSAEFFEKLKEQKARGAFVKLTYERMEDHLDMFQEFCSVNYTTAIKSLKKHDKVLDAETQSLYTANVLNYQKFHTKIGLVVQRARKELQSSVVVPAELLAGASDDEDDQVDFGKHRTPSIPAAVAIQAYQPRQYRDLNNDVARPRDMKKEALCVPVRRVGQELFVLTILNEDSKGVPTLVKVELESGETAQDAAIRGLLEVAGVRATVERNIGEFMSTSRKLTVYDAFLLTVEEELEDWLSRSEVHRKWMLVDDAVAEVEDTSSIRVLRRV